MAVPCIDLLGKDVYDALRTSLGNLPDDKLNAEQIPDGKEYLARAQQCSDIFIAGVFQSCPGSVLLTTQRVMCANEEEDLYVSLAYKDVLMHAICKDEEYFPRPCLYLQLDASEKEGDEEGQGETQGPVEVRFVPENSDQLEEFFKVFSACASLHPDLDEDFNPTNESTEEAVLSHLDSVLHVAEGVKPPVAVANQFDDAEDEESPSTEPGPGA